MNMSLEELYDYLVRNGILVEPDPDKVSVYDYARFREFKTMISEKNISHDRLDDFLSKIESIKSDLDDLGYDIESLKE